LWIFILFQAELCRGAFLVESEAVSGADFIEVEEKKQISELCGEGWGPRAQPNELASQHMIYGNLVGLE